MAKIVVDGNEYEVNPNNNLLQECLSLGLDLPYFCWHPCMGSVGACRQCAVKQYRDENDEKGTIVMACMTPASDGARISIADEQAHDMRERVIEISWDSGCMASGIWPCGLWTLAAWRGLILHARLGCRGNRVAWSASYPVPDPIPVPDPQRCPMCPHPRRG